MKTKKSAVAEMRGDQGAKAAVKAAEDAEKRQAKG
jgi:hypothetical protein